MLIFDFLKVKYFVWKIKLARKLFKSAFEGDNYFRGVYKDNIAMLLHDRYGITDHKTRNEAAKVIMEVIFDAKEIKVEKKKVNKKNIIKSRCEILEI